MNLQEQFDAKRRQYMANEISHKEFYLWVADSIAVNRNDLPFSIERIQASTDPHLNDLPLAKWDRCDPIIRSKATHAGIRAWSLSNTVSVLKSYARREAGK